MRRRPWDAEEEAGEIVTHWLGGAYRRRDPGGGAVPLHDLDVILDDNRVVAVEVTRHTVALEAKRDAAITSRRWRCRDLGRWWVVDVGRAVNVAVLHRRLCSLLVVLEEAGVERISVYDRLELPAVQELVRLGVRMAYTISNAPPEDEDNPIIGEASSAGSTSEEVVVRVVDDHANRSDNVRKLASADADLRHLFVWVERSHDDVVAAMSGLFLPDRAPTVPDSVDAVWVATAFHPSTVWRYDRRLGWEDLGSWKAERRGHLERTCQVVA